MKNWAMLEMKKDDLTNLTNTAKDFAFAKGIAMRCPDLSYDARVFLPFCLLPSFFPKEWFQLAKNVQKDMNYILHQVAHDADFLLDCLSSTVKVDEFTREIVKIYETVLREGNYQPLSLGLFRCDYLLDAYKGGEVKGIKQVENNTIASGFAGMSPKVRELHSFVLDRIGIPYTQSELPENNATIDFARGIISAWEAYGKEQAVVLFVVEDFTYNICDQRALEYTVLELKKDIRILRCKFKDLRSSAALKDHCLFVCDSEVAVVYFRYGYVPKHYSAKDWEIRLLIERSLAIKCPSAAYHLAGTKRVQLKLAAPGVLEKYISDEEAVKTIRQIFVNQLSLEMNKEGDNAVCCGIDNPHSYVMKPEREGGGNNIYGEEIKNTLQVIGSTDARQAYILMEKINPPSRSNYIIRRDVSPVMSQVVGELGIFGVILGSKDEVLMNYEAGHLLRSKETDLNEGGVSSGFGALDSPYLI